jgi:NAD(P)-dependent dehydrogenase (short-subunit alcohol dehydrogenase family)
VRPRCSRGTTYAPRMPDLDGTRALVTGATSGLGRAMAEALHLAGGRVAVTGRDGARCERVAAGLGDRAVGVALDVRDPVSVRDGVDAVVERLGGVDLLVANAGIGQQTVNPRFLTEPAPFWDAAPDAFRAVVDTKIVGTFLTVREVVPRMLAAGGGRVVVISMNESTMTRAGFAPYGPSGAGVEALARVMAGDLEGTPVTLNILLPGGATETGMIPEDVPGELRAGLLDPAIMGPPIVWLASPAAAGVHGERVVATEFGSPS